MDKIENVFICLLLAYIMKIVCLGNEFVESDSLAKEASLDRFAVRSALPTKSLRCKIGFACKKGFARVGNSRGGL